MSPRVTVAMDGAAGAVPAMNGLLAADATPSPIELVATTVQVYVRPFDSEATVNGELSPVLERVVPPVVEVQVAL